MTRAATRMSRATLAVIVLLLAEGSGLAQPADPRLEASVGGLFLGGYSLGSANADLISNQTGGGTYTIFKSETTVDATLGLESRLGFGLSRMFVVEGGVLVARPSMTTRLSADVEDAPAITASQDLSLYIIDAAFVARFGTRRLRPFVRLGVGYVRELHNDNLLVETGTAVHAGGGLTIWFREGRRRRVGVRADGRLYVLRDGISFGKGSRTLGAAGAGVVFGF